MDTCEILIVLLFIIMAVVPLAIVMTIVELLNKRKMKFSKEIGLVPEETSIVLVCPPYKFGDFQSQKLGGSLT